MSEPEPNMGAVFLASLDKRIALAAESDDPDRQAHGRRLEFMRPFLRTRYLTNPKAFSARVDQVMREFGFEGPEDGSDDFARLD